MRILAIMCHPDDMEFSCAGTLLKCKKRGDDVIVCHATNGNMGHMVIMPDELRKIRLAEAQKASALAGFETVTADFGDLTVNASDTVQQQKLLRIIRYARPDAIITHAPEDYCSDHAELSKMVFNVSFSASCPHFLPDAGEACPVTPVFYADTDLSVSFVPTEYVDITDEMEQKLAMLACHESQLTWLREHDGSDPLADERTKSRDRGIQCGVLYAEAYRQLLASQRMRTYRILP